MGRSCGKEQQRQEMSEMEAEGQDKLQTELLCYQRGKTLKQRAVEAAVEICAHTNEDFAAEVDCMTTSQRCCLPKAARCYPVIFGFLFAHTSSQRR